MRASRPTGFTQGRLRKRRDVDIPPYGIYTRKAEEAAGCGHPALRDLLKGGWGRRDEGIPPYGIYTREPGETTG